MQRCWLQSCAGCQLIACGNCRSCRRKRGCDKRVFAGPCENQPEPKPPRRDPAARRAAAAAAAPPKARSQWSEAENETCDELYAQGGRDRKQFGTDLSAALKGSKTPAQCERKYSQLKKAEPKHQYVFAYDPENPKEHSAELFAALPEELKTLEKDEITKLWEEEVEGKGWDAARALLKGARDRVWNYFGDDNIEIVDIINMLAEAGLPPQFLDLEPKPPLRNSQAFREAFDHLRNKALAEKQHRTAALDLLTGKPTECLWGFLKPGETRSDNALQKEMSNKSCQLVALAEGANPLTQLPKSVDRAQLKRMSISPPFEAVASDAKHATCPSYARQFRCATRGAFVTHPSRGALLANALLFGITQVSIAGSVSAALL